MDECLFCSIASGAIPSAKVYEDDQVFAFLDINPLREGHVLVIPKQHAQRLLDMDGAEASALMRGTQRVVGAVNEAMGSHDATVAINDGPAAGQEVPHVHVHVVPRREGDGGGPIHALFHDRPRVDQESITATANRIRGALEARA